MNLSTNIYNIDFFIVAIFLLLNLCVGLYYGRGVKTIEDYALGGRNFSTASLVSTIVATVITGSLFTGGIASTYDEGWNFLLPACGLSISLLLSAYYFIPRMSSFLGSLSVAQSMGEYYGTTVRVITAICAVIACTGGIAVQYKVLGSVSGYFLNFDQIITVVISGMIVTLYSTFGGIRSVTITDVLQFTIFGAVIPMVGILIWKSQVILPEFSYAPVLATPRFDIIQTLNPSNPEFPNMILLLIYFTIPATYPAFFQRMIIGRDVKQVKLAFTISAAALLAIILAVAWIGFLIYAVNPNLDSTQLIPFVIDNYTYVGFKGFLIVGIMAMAMSSADSFINTASILFAHDICKPLKMFKINELALTRYFALFLGFSSIVIAIFGKDLFKIILAANAFYLPVVTAPLLLTTLGFRTSKLTILSGMFVGFATIIIFKIKEISYNSIVPGIMLNLITIFIIHYLFRQKGGWFNMLPTTQTINLQHANYRNSYFKIFDLITKYVPKKEAICSFFGIYCFVSTISTIYLTHEYLLTEYSQLIMIIYQLMLIISSFFMLYVMWSPRVKHPLVVAFMWHFSLIYMLIYCPSLFFLKSNFDNIHMFMMTISLMVLFTLAYWKTVPIITSIGLFLAYLTNKYGFDADLPTSYANKHQIFIYISLLVIGAIIAFIRSKLEYVEAIKFKKQVLTFGRQNYTDEGINTLGKNIRNEIINNINFITKFPIINIRGFDDILNNSLISQDENELKNLYNEINQSKEPISFKLLDLFDKAVSNANKITLDKQIINFSILVEDRVNFTKKIYSQKSELSFDINMETNLMIFADANYMRQLVDNILINAISNSKNGVIKLYLNRTYDKRGLELRVEDNGLPIAEKILDEITMPSNIMHDFESKSHQRTIGLKLCSEIIKAHGGIFEILPNNNSGARFIVLIELFG